MSVTIYVGKDFLGETQLPETDHEAKGVYQVCRYLWETWFHASDRHFAIVANPQQTETGTRLSADLVIVSQRGLGVVELKHVYGDIECQGSNQAWFAGKGFRIKAGKYLNPYLQVRHYMQQIREDLLRTTHLPGEPPNWPQFQFQTAVCFTNYRANIDKCRDRLHYFKPTEPGEGSFNILHPEGISQWAESLRFNARKGIDEGFAAFQWTPEQVNKIATEFFGAREWRSLINQVSEVGKPYGYLTLQEGMSSQVYSLHRDNVLIGRELDCHVVVPGGYLKSGRYHARIMRFLSADIILEDNNSMNGTYVNNCRILERYRLQDGDVIALGRPGPNQPEVCELRFTLEPPLSVGKTAVRTTKI